MDDYYAILGLDRTASAGEIDRAVREQLRVWQRRTAHADLDRRQEAEQRVRLLGEARTVLRDPASRRDYDQRLAVEPATDAPMAVSFPARAPRSGTGWYLVGGAVLALAVIGALCESQLALPFLIVGALIAVPAGLAAGRRLRDRVAALHIDADGITLTRGRGHTSYPWREIESVTVRQTHEAAPAALVIEGAHAQTIDLSRHGIPAEPLRRVLARFAGGRLRE